ncbi:DNA-binding WRKY transcription factor [Phycomyces blakesleeanus NRRL 1555(-)]|uniref:DNA-binding WRKY transcription factor n=1 Tax=Phycomyces blakesleeanus (strain ATCC 8743b / DSM 1359 / FGSC 10004 / NBRC 33097 / NRRL 1555) TaxID=763407 RepID=A0A167PWT5_PHYB8|nr:DNA-binding WRKY transcription factor [Phycomyces blakesleeanus NRRL 1555(-)]OAD78677.1 DNA-binding WRKY transcription factor [Phycomyces blakesleeanus NRRL 1555(-)]|eukprot:XP_018296717.1 DNA-binding WRKY transcription factor [Phycomyces blakesleeanus NRRL 1555(-)]
MSSNSPDHSGFHQKSRHSQQQSQSAATQSAATQESPGPSSFLSLERVVQQYGSRPELLELILSTKVEEDRRRAEEAKLRRKEIDYLLHRHQSTDSSLDRPNTNTSNSNNNSNIRSWKQSSSPKSQLRSPASHHSHPSVDEQMELAAAGGDSRQRDSRLYLPFPGRRSSLTAKTMPYSPLSPSMDYPHSQIQLSKKRHSLTHTINAFPRHAERLIDTLDDTFDDAHGTLCQTSRNLLSSGIPPPSPPIEATTFQPQPQPQSQAQAQAQVQVQTQAQAQAQAQAQVQPQPQPQSQVPVQAISQGISQALVQDQDQALDQDQEHDHDHDQTKSKIQNKIRDQALEKPKTEEKLVSKRPHHTREASPVDQTSSKRKRREMQAITTIIETREFPYNDNYLWKNNGNTVHKKTGHKSIYYKCSNSAKGCLVNKTVTFRENGEHLIKYRGQHLNECSRIKRIIDI